MRKAGKIVSPEGSFLELDFWIPELKLAFEFQVKYLNRIELNYFIYLFIFKIIIILFRKVTITHPHRGLFILFLSFNIVTVSYYQL